MLEEVLERRMAKHAGADQGSPDDPLAEQPAELPVSLLCYSFAEWRQLYRKYLEVHGMYRPGSTDQMNRRQEPGVTPRDSPYVSLLRQAVILLTDAYDVRPVYAKDIWNLKQMGVATNLS